VTGFRQRQVAREVSQISPVGLPHEEELLRVADHRGTDARGLEPGILLDDRGTPAVVLAELGIALGHDLLATRGIEEAGQLLEQDAFPRRTREREDVLPGESANE